MQINGTNWYTASGYHGEQIKGSERSMIRVWYGYCMPIQDKDEKETKSLMGILKADGVITKLKTSKHTHTGIPAGTPFLQVSDEESIIALEKIFLKQGIELSPDRYKEYGLDRILRPVKDSVAPVAKKSIWSKFFGRG